MRIVRGMLLKGNGWSEIWPDLWPIALFTLVIVAFASFDLSARRWTEARLEPMSLNHKRWVKPGCVSTTPVMAGLVPAIHAVV